MDARPQPLKILFFLGHDGHLRNFEPAIKELAERGHTVHLALSQRRAPLLTASRSLEELAAAYPTVTFDRLPKDKANRYGPLLEMLGSSRMFLRFLRPEYARAPKLRERGAEHAPRRVAGLAARPLFRTRLGRRLLDRALLTAIRALPPSPALTSYIRSQAPDVALFTPLIGFGTGQQGALRAAKTVGVPTALLVHSWDNLTNKGVLHEQPDRVVVWNEAQRREAIELQGVSAKRVVVTGAHSYDPWFATRSASSREEFCRKVGLDASVPFVLYVGSSSFIAPEEAAYVRGWVERLRASGNPLLRDIGVLVRPHPQNAEEWAAGVEAPAGAAVWPRPGTALAGPEARADYYDSIHHAAAVVGVNTSALIESAIQGRPVLTLLADEFRDTQEGTLHFDHLTDRESGMLQVARTWDEHELQLAAALANPAGAAERARVFLEAFVRPHGSDEPATPRLVEAVEALATQAPAPLRAARRRALGLALAPAAALALTPLAVRAMRSKRRAKSAGKPLKPPKAASPLKPPKPSKQKGGLRVLFFMRAINYDRLFEASLRELLARGHRVHVAFDLEKKGWAGESPVFSALAEQYATLSFGPIPELAQSPWAVFASKLRFAIDFLRYLEPRFQQAPALRERARDRAPWLLVRASRWPVVRSRAGRRLLGGSLRLLEACVPLDPRLLAFVREQAPNVVLVTPLVGLGSDQGDYIRAARRLGVPTGVAIASWDNLTNKGIIRDAPDATFVWNDAQVGEAVELHGIPAEKVIATGAHTYDQWFDWQASMSRERFCAKVGLDPARQYLLYVCSSRFIAPEEAAWVERWVRRLRESGDERLRDVGVLVRPHPANAEVWQHVELTDPGRAAVYPREGATPTTDDRKNDYYDSIKHCAAVVGVNTSALIESAIVGRPVFTLLAPEFRETQEGTLHFAHLTGDSEGGMLTIARSWEEHERQLADALSDTDAFAVRNAAFVESFVRGPGRGPATKRLVDAIEMLAVLRPQAARTPMRTLVRIVATPFVYAVPAVYRPFAQLGFRPRRPLREGPPAAGRALRILFVIEHPGLLIHFDGTVGGLLDRGHNVFVAFARPQKTSRSLKFAYAIEALMTAEHRLKIIREIPHRSDWFTRISLRVRAAADYIHYLHPDLAGAHYSRAKWREIAFLPRGLRSLERRETLPRWVMRPLLGSVAAIENAIPSSAEVERLLEKLDPDLVLVSPLVDRRPPQTDYVKSARALRIPSAVLVTSWDNLTSKGMLRLAPDRVVVWNETQRREAEELHRVPADRIVTTGAQQFDRWFDREPSATREELLRGFGLPLTSAYVLFVGSTSQGQAPEAEPELVRRWVTALRQSPDPRVRGLSVLVRPHPVNAEGWLDPDLSDLGSVVVWKRKNLLPVQEQDRSDYFDAMHHSAAVFGINSSAMVEAAILDRPVHTVALPELRPMQRDLLHFHYLLPENGGFLREAQSFEEHVALLADDLRDPAPGQEARRRFVESFLRPNGIDNSATQILLDAIEETARVEPFPAPEGRLYLYPLRGLVAAAVAADRIRVTYHRGIRSVASRGNKVIGRRLKKLEATGGSALRRRMVGAGLYAVGWANTRGARSQHWLKDREESRKTGIVGGDATEPLGAWSPAADDLADGSRHPSLDGAAKPAKPKAGSKPKPKPKPEPQAKARPKAKKKSSKSSRWRDLLETPRR